MYLAMNPTDPVTRTFADDGRIPNNPKLPLVLYRGCIDLAGTPYPEELVEKTFTANGSGDMWRNDSVHVYPHYHSTIHEAMAVARGRATVRFGGESGQVIDIRPGDVVILPAPAIRACSRAPDFLSSAPIRRTAPIISAAPPKQNASKRFVKSPMCRRHKPIRCSARRVRW
jgi:uncharacterized protein YjlB